jgi:hypothetical protein
MPDARCPPSPDAHASTQARPAAPGCTRPRPRRGRTGTARAHRVEGTENPLAAKTATLRDRFAAADPGLLRLTAGLRAVLGLTLTLATLALLDQPSVVLLAGGFTAVVTSLAISDLHPRNQFRTLLAGAPVTLAALTAGRLLASFPLASRPAFLPLIFAAVYAAASDDAAWTSGSSASWPTSCPSSPKSSPINSRN